ncbi:MAG: outer membrane beta-barrel protein [Betaproteobacteria bacterium]|nr:outer membrane beta-barrel protein [Betaproteobacteria bacterium]
MNSTTVTAARRIAPFALAFAAHGAHALEGDRIRPSVGLSYTYNSNLYYLDDRLNASQFSFIKDGQKSDQTFGLKAGLDIDHYWSRQTFRLRSQITNNRNQTYDSLDYSTYDVRGTWDWVYGERWDGDAGYQRNRVASNFYDFRTADRTARNLRTQDVFFGSAMLKMTPDWKLRGALRYTTVNNGLSRFANQDRNEWVAEAGSRRYSKGTDDYIGFNLRFADGNFPNREVLATSTVDNAYRQYTAEGVIDYQYSGLTRISGNLGYTTRQQKQLSQRNFSGMTGRLTVTYAWSSKTTLTGAVFREVGGWEDLTTNYVVTQGATASATQSLTDKFLVQVNYSLRRRAFQGDPEFILFSFPTRKDTFQSYSVGLVWTPYRNVRVDGTVAYDTRDTNDAWQASGYGPYNSFNVTTIYLSGTVTF